MFIIVDVYNDIVVGEFGDGLGNDSFVIVESIGNGDGIILDWREESVEYMLID